MISKLLGYFLLVLFLTIIPLTLGGTWSKYSVVKGKIALLFYSYAMGFFSELAMFELVVVPLAIFTVPFNIIMNIYITILIVALYISIKNLIKNHSIQKFKLIQESKWTKYEVILLIFFLVLLIYQLYYAVFYSRTYMADDGYVAFSTAAISDNYINMTHRYTGLYLIHYYSWIQRIIQSFNFFPAFLSYISGINPAIISHTVIYSWVVIFSYMVYFVMADQLFDNRENKLIFASLTCVLFIWGYHSHYSLSFRLLGPNDSGKAILAVILSPFMMTIMYKTLQVGYRINLGIQILVLSIAACSLTLGGVYTFAAIIVTITCLSSVKNRTIKPLFYSLWGGTVPLGFTLLYLSYR